MIQLNVYLVQIVLLNTHKLKLHVIFKEWNIKAINIGMIATIAIFPAI